MFLNPILFRYLSPKFWPKGSKGTTPVYVANTRCRKCQSTRKKALRIVEDRPIGGTDDKGRPYNRVVWRRVQCANCGQHRVEIERHYDGDPPKPDSHRPQTSV